MKNQTITTIIEQPPISLTIKSYHFIASIPLQTLMQSHTKSKPKLEYLYKYFF